MKKQSILFISILLVTITLLPALIVMPFEENAEDLAMDGRIAQGAPSEISEGEETVITVYRDQLGTTEEVPLEDYVVSVVAAEIPADFEMEALKAQALAARTYIVQKLQKKQGDQEYDVTDTVEHQVYKNFDELRDIWGVEFTRKFDRIQQAVKETEGEIITYEDQPIQVAFFSTSNGFTENAEDYWTNEIPYLKSVASPWDEQSPKFKEQQVFSNQEVFNRLGIETSLELRVENVVRTKSERIDKLQLNGVEFSGREIREKLGLRSNDFEIERKGDHVIFTTRGYGHGVGMSQYGANGMASEGKNYEYILKHYYQGVEINSLEEFLTNKDKI
ncbi:stage II sporulation protein D [Halalkalibacillus sediminis]|uniref:Stage II sporulation protein D n=1 Tax=Halalkalibacillus sediminis TaxID=2018042 RepID=A0A2I0QTX0_9BACI|nr:stage II sporulation protein D [Halalkalibacillus sediminis]PKR77759.1 stage II sporulation protein D [Halalkalibacillus sediminis]